MGMDTISQKVLDWFLSVGSEPLYENYRNANQKLSFRCQCGNLSEITYRASYQGSLPRCRPCSYKLRTLPHSLERSDIELWLQANGATLLTKGEIQAKTPISFLCSCGKEGRTSYQNSYRGSMPLCRSCQLSVRPRGANHYKWNSNLSDLDRLKSSYGRGSKFSIWSRKVLRRDDYTCAVSNLRGGRLSAHHLYNWADYPDLRFELSNGITISEEVHKDFHKKFGYGNNSPAQLNQYSKEFYGRDLNL